VTAVRGGRPPRIRPEEILDVVAERVDDSWTMGSIATVLGVSEAAIYYYYPTKADLLVAVGQRLFAALELPRLGSNWQTWLTEVGLCMYDFFVRYPVMTNASVDILGDTAGEAWSTEAPLSDLVSLGFTIADADLALTTIMVLATGYANMTVFLDGPRGQLLKERITQRAALEPDTLTSRTQLSESGWDIRERFIAALALVVEGLRAR
jgi:AcrR family transcriptional regulator